MWWLVVSSAVAGPSPEQVAAWAVDAVPVVLPVLEDVLGRRLAAPPPVRVVDQATFLAEERARIAPQVAAAHPGADPHAFAAAVDGYVAGLAHVPAAWEYDAGVLYVVVEPMIDALAFAPLPSDEATRGAVGCAVAHELTHALQRQEVGDPPLVGDPSALAASAAREGQASWAGAEVCRRLGQDGAAVWHLLVQGALGRRADADRDLVYRQGVRAVERASGDAGWALVAAPPAAESIAASTAAEEAAWTALGSRVDQGDCAFSREFRPEDLRITTPPDLTPVHDALDDVRWLSWCGRSEGGVGHAVLARPSAAGPVAALIRAKLRLPDGEAEPERVRGFDATTRVCGDGCTWSFARGDRLAIVAGPADLRAQRVARRVLRSPYR